jgi:signal transduction histidine kinase
VQSWLGVPFVVGKRVVGLVWYAARQQNAYDPNRVKRAVLVAAHLTPTVETSLALAEASHHLEKMAVLNELASAAAIGMETGEVARRIVQRLRRIFNTDWVSVLLLSDDGEFLREFGDSLSEIPSLVLRVKESLAGQVVETGLPILIGDVQQDARYSDTRANVHSELAVPLKYRGKVIGVLDLVSHHPEAFTQADGQLLVVIASHLAGLLENVRLHEETRLRAINMEVLHHVVGRIVGLTDVDEIAQVTARMMAEHFAFDLAVIALADAPRQNLIVIGAGGIGEQNIPRGMQIPLEAGMMGRVFQSGQSCMINDTHLEARYLILENWQAGSEMCVPLWEGEQVYGVVNVERIRKDAFTENDLLTLEALAGVLSTVILNARSYQQLHINLRHLQAVRETALDISADLDLDTLLRRVTLRARELVGAQGAELGLVNEKNRTVEIKVSENPWQDYYRGLVIPFSQGVAGQMAVHGEPIAVEDYKGWQGRLHLEKDAPFTAVAGVPLKYKSQVIGTLTVSYDERERSFSPDDVQLLELLAPQVAVSVRNARLYQELQESMEAERVAEDRLIQSARLAAVGEMAAGVAHELNNPLTTVAGFVELVLDELPKDSQQRADLELVLREALRAREVVRRLLDFSRPGEGFRVQADLNDLSREVLALIRHLAHTSGVEIDLQFHSELPLIQVDRDQIKQVLLNLIHNALQAMPRGGILTIQTAPAKHQQRAGAQVLVKDTGHGITPEDLGRIFEPFFTTRPPGKGTGLGLAVSYGIVTDHGGFIEVVSEPGKGSCFTVWLPVESSKALI